MTIQHQDQASMGTFAARIVDQSDEREDGPRRNRDRSKITMTELGEGSAMTTERYEQERAGATAGRPVDGPNGGATA